MRRLSALLLLMSLVVTASAQNIARVVDATLDLIEAVTDTDPKSKNTPPTKIDKSPKFQNGDQSKFRTWVISNSKNLSSGRATAKFVVNKMGQVTNVKVESSNPKLASAIKETIQRSPKWTPAEAKGHKIDTQLSMMFEVKGAPTPDKRR